MALRGTSTLFGLHAPPFQSLTLRLVSLSLDLKPPLPKLTYIDRVIKDNFARTDRNPIEALRVLPAAGGYQGARPHWDNSS